MAPLLSSWPVRVAWALLPVTMGPALGEALGEHSRVVARTGSGGAWLVWAAGLVAVAVPRTVSLTGLRIAAPAVVAVAVWATATGPGDVDGLDVLAVTWAALVLLAALAPTTGDTFVNGSSYGDERRMLLRVPLPLLVAPVPFAWLATVAGPITAPLLLASRAWVAGGIAVLVGGAATVAGARALHGLARRWVVFVPAGLVLHDLQAMADPVFFPRASIARLGPAVELESGAADEVLDLSSGALGLLLQLDVREPRDVAPRRGRRALDPVQVEHVRFAPSRPGALLAEASARRIAVG